MSKKSSRSGLTTALICGGIAIACVGVGVGAWIVGDGSILPATVGGIEVSGDGASGFFGEITNAKVIDSSVCFGTLVNDLGVITSDENTEDLSFSISFDIGLPEGAGSEGNVSIPVTASVSQDLIELSDEGLIVLPFVPGESFDVVSIEGEDTLVPIDGDRFSTSIDGNTVSVTFTFGWGGRFDGKNPVLDEEYFLSDKDEVITTSPEAYAAVEKLKTLGSSTSIDLTVGG